MNIKTIALGVLTLGLSFLYALFQKQRADHLDDDNQRLQDSYDAEKRNSSALAESEKIYDERIETVKTSPVDRNHFGRQRRL